MTKTIIDASNILAMGFYNGVLTETGKAKVNVKGTSEEKSIISQGSISTAMMVGLRLQTMIASPDSAYNKEDDYKGLTNFNITVNNLGGSAVFLISAFVFVSVALLFIVRFVALLFYMLFSPVAFLGLISPELKEYSAKWWKGLQSQALFAPAFLFMAYLISAIINSGQLWTAVGGNDSKSTLYDAISSPTPAAFPIIMNYVILMALMIGALILAKSMASQGSAGMVGFAQKFQGWAQGVAGRNIIGRSAHLLGDSAAMAKLNALSPTLGGFVKNRFDGVAGASFGGDKGGYTKTLKDRIKKQTERAKWIDKKLGTNAATKEKETDLKQKKDDLEKQENESGELKGRVSSAKDNYEKLEKERQKRQEIYEIEKKIMKGNNKKDAGDAEKALEIASNKAEQAKEELENEEKKLKINQETIKISKEAIDRGGKELTAMKNKWKYTFADNLKYSSSVMNMLFPSGAAAADAIRKGEKSPKEIFEEVLKGKEEEAEKKEKKKDKI